MIINKFAQSPLSHKKSGWLKLTMMSALLGLMVTLAGCSDKPADASNTAQTDEKSEDGKEKKEKAPIPVEVVAVARGDIQQTYRTITTLEAERDAQVIARSTGLVRSILVEE
ncbi:MAG: ABC-type glycerol-3-phosphate transport system substrate-binding protein, partial [Phenylobacterium sp.]